MYISVISYMLLLCILYTYVMQYYIICIICLHPIQSRRCIMIIAYDRYVLCIPAPYSVTALHNDYCITAAARERPPISLWSTRRRGTPVKRALQRRSTMRSAGAAPFARAARARSGTARAQRPVRTPPAGGHTGTGGPMRRRRVGNVAAFHPPSAPARAS